MEVKNGVPVFVIDKNRPIDYAEGIKALLRAKGWTYQDLADHIGYSKRTVEGWGQGRIPSKPALFSLARLL